MNTNMFTGLNDAAKIIHRNNVEKGFWDNERNVNVGEMLMLVNTELCEALEAHRKNHFADYEGFKDLLLQNQDFGNEAFSMKMKNTFEDEIADSIIRLLDLSAGLNIDIERHINLKLAYNKTRPYKHGKNY